MSANTAVNSGAGKFERSDEAARLRVFAQGMARRQVTEQLSLHADGAFFLVVFPAGFCQLEAVVL